MLVSYTVMRNKGFRITPFNASKVPALGGLALAGLIGYAYGLNYGRVVLGNANQFYYLTANSSGIKSGTKPFDAPQVQ